MTKPSPSTEFNTFSSIVIHHKKDESGFFSCPNKSTAVNTGLENIFRDWFVKVYIIHIPIIADFERYVKEYQIPLVALLVFKRLVDTHQNQYARDSQHAVYPVKDYVHISIIPG